LIFLFIDFLFLIISVRVPHLPPHFSPSSSRLILPFSGPHFIPYSIFYIDIFLVVTCLDSGGLSGVSAPSFAALVSRFGDALIDGLTPQQLSTPGRNVTADLVPLLQPWQRARELCAAAGESLVDFALTSCSFFFHFCVVPLLELSSSTSAFSEWYPCCSRGNARVLCAALAEGL
jgi:hypothetical protein